MLPAFFLSSPHGPKAFSQSLTARINKKTLEPKPYSAHILLHPFPSTHSCTVQGWALDIGRQWRRRIDSEFSTQFEDS